MKCYNPKGMIPSKHRTDNPLHISIDRIALYGFGCAFLTSLPFIFLPWFREVTQHGDYADFSSAGATVGTPILTHPSLLAQWQTAHGLGTEPFVYFPAFAWLYAPLAHLPRMTGLVIEEVLMASIFIAAALVAADVYGFGRLFSVLMVFAWAPTVNAIEVAQHTGITLLLAFSTIGAIARKSESLAGLFVGVLLYKPTVALPFLVLFAVRRNLKALGVVAACALVWYLLSIPASGGDIRWPLQHAHVLEKFYSVVARGFGFRQFALPEILASLGAPPSVAVASAAMLLLSSIPLLLQRPVFESASMVMLVGLAASLHAWPYELALALPPIFYAMKVLREPARTTLAIATYVSIAVGMSAPYGSTILVIICNGGAACWLASFYAPFRHLRFRTLGDTAD